MIGSTTDGDRLNSVGKLTAAFKRSRNVEALRSARERLMMIVIIGPAGSGKSEVVGALAKEGLLHPQSTWTDRGERPDDKRSIEHLFVSKEKFNQLVDEGFFIGTADLFSHRYGLPPWPEQRSGILTVILVANLVDQFMKVVGDEPVLVYQISAPFDALHSTLTGRSLSKAELNARLGERETEIALGSMIADRSFVNDGSIENLIDEVRAAIIEDVPSAIDLTDRAELDIRDQDSDAQAQVIELGDEKVSGTSRSS